MTLPLMYFGRSVSKTDRSVTSCTKGNTSRQVVWCCCWDNMRLHAQPACKALLQSTWQP